MCHIVLGEGCIGHLISMPRIIIIIILYVKIHIKSSLHSLNLDQSSPGPVNPFLRNAGTCPANK
jgi:hypothetical protein